MTILPQTVIEQIEFCEAHWPVWTPAAVSIGLAAPMVAAMKTATETARNSYNLAQAAREASKAATTTLNSNAAIMRGQVADLIRQIKAFAELQANPNTVYAAAQIPAPTPPSPLPVPGVPSNFQTILEPDGSITLSWDAANASASTGTFFTISRKPPGQIAFVGVGGAPGITTESRRASFTDATVPASAAAAGAQYIVQGFRGTRSGEPSDAVTVQFGLGEGGTFTSVRLAA